VQSGDKLGFVNSEGKEIVRPIYDNIEAFNARNRNNWALVERDGAYGFIDSNGKEAVTAIYDSIEAVLERAAQVDKDDEN
jgi:hypothetical protein